jgi:membrane protease YdiL (CAAX protease family)
MPGKGVFPLRDIWRFLAVSLIVSLLSTLFLEAGLFLSPDGYVLSVLAGKLVLFAYLLWLVQIHRKAWPAIGIAFPGRPGGWLLALAVYAVSYPLLLEATSLNESLLSHGAAWLGLTYRPAWQKVTFFIVSGYLAEPIRLVLIVFTVLPGPLIEEIAFRGVALAALRPVQGTFWALVWTSLLFGLFHLSLAILLPISLLGIVFGLARLLSGSLWGGLFIHCLHNALTLWLTLDAAGRL